VAEAIKSFEDLEIWRAARELKSFLRELIKKFPDTEKYRLVDQIIRAKRSVTANIAEGFGRARKAEFRRFLEIARGSLFELQTHAELGRRFGWIAGKELGVLRNLTHELDAVLDGLIRSVKRRPA